MIVDCPCCSSSSPLSLSQIFPSSSSFPLHPARRRDGRRLAHPDPDPAGRGDGLSTGDLGLFVGDQSEQRRQPGNWHTYIWRLRRPRTWRRDYALRSKLTSAISAAYPTPSLLLTPGRRDGDHSTTTSSSWPATIQAPNRKNCLAAILASGESHGARRKELEVAGEREEEGEGW